MAILATLLAGAIASATKSKKTSTEKRDTATKSTSKTVADAISTSAKKASTKSVSTAATEGTTAQQAQTKSTETQGQTAQQKSETLGTTSLLDEESQLFIKDLLASLKNANGVDAQQISDLTQTITDRALTSQADITAQLNPIIEDARLKGENELQALQTQLAQQAGGSLANTNVTSGVAQGRASLESDLARLSAELQLNARDITTKELSGAVTDVNKGQQTGQQNITNIAQLLNVLKGADVTQTQVAAQSSSSELSKILSALTEQQGQQSTLQTTQADTIANTILEAINKKTQSTVKDSTTKSLTKSDTAQKSERFSTS